VENKSLHVLTGSMDEQKRAKFLDRKTNDFQWLKIADFPRTATLTAVVRFYLPETRTEMPKNRMIV
jgi:hypothetical protein